MKISESLGYGILIFAGLGALKLFGGVKGLTDMFGGIFDFLPNGKNGNGNGITTVDQKIDEIIRLSGLTGNESDLLRTKLQGESFREQIDPLYYAFKSAPFPFGTAFNVFETLYGGTPQEEATEEMERQATIRYLEEQRSKSQLITPIPIEERAGMNVVTGMHIQEETVTNAYKLAQEQLANYESQVTGLLNPYAPIESGIVRFGGR